MALTSLKQEEGDNLGEYTPQVFGYGTEIYLNGDQCEALGLTRLDAGQTVNIRATGIVSRSTQELEAPDGDDGKDLSVSIQLTAIDVSPVGTANSKRAAQLLYGGGDE